MLTKDVLVYQSAFRTSREDKNENKDRIKGCCCQGLLLDHFRSEITYSISWESRHATSIPHGRIESIPKEGRCHWIHYIALFLNSLYRRKEIKIKIRSIKYILTDFSADETECQLFYSHLFWLDLSCCNRLLDTDFLESTSPAISASVYPSNTGLPLPKHKHTLEVPLRYLRII